jgi:GT2 family glycosyltransferase
MIRTSRDVASAVAGYLNSVRRRLAAETGDISVTVVFVVRHGYATTRVSLESLYATTRIPFIVFYLDINSPAMVRQYLAEQAVNRKNFFHITIDEYVSRQTARLLVLDMITTPYAAFIDNNIMFTEGWLEQLIETSKKDDASVVSPLIVMQGGNVHFSGARIELVEDGVYKRTQTTEKAPMAIPLKDAQPEKLEIDFAESHCCLIKTDCFRGKASEFFLEDMHNSFTLAVAAQRIQRQSHCRMLIEPKAVVSVLPIAFGYDIPWLFECYNNLEMFKLSYARHEQQSGRSESSSLSNLRWHRHHLLYLLMTMTEKDHLENKGLLQTHEVPADVYGYDKTLPEDALFRIRKYIRPFVESEYPQYSALLEMWIYEINDVIENIESRIGRTPRRPSSSDHVGFSFVICSHNGAERLPQTLRHLTALRNTAVRPWEVIVVDNASTDHTAEVARNVWSEDAPAPLRVVKEPRLGLGHARLKGIQMAAHQIVSFVDDDNWVSDDWLDEVGHVLETRPDIGAMGVYSEPVFASAPPAWFEQVKGSYAVGHQGADAGDISNARGMVWGAGSSYRVAALRDAIERFGPPVVAGRTGDKPIGSGEDSELCYMVKAAGWKIWYDPSIKIKHFVPPHKLNWSYLCGIHVGFGVASVGLARYQLQPPANSQESGISWKTALLRKIERRWQGALVEVALRLWRLRRQAMRIVFSKGEGQVESLPVYWQIGRLIGLLRWRQRYNTGFGKLANL